MSIKLHCTACEKFIKDLSENETKKTTGKELCDGCATKIKSIFADIEKAAADYHKNLDSLYGEAEREYNRFQKFREQNQSQVKVVLNNIRPEIEIMVRRIFKEE